MVRRPLLDRLTRPSASDWLYGVQGLLIVAALAVMVLTMMRQLGSPAAPSLSEVPPLQVHGGPPMPGARSSSGAGPPTGSPPEIGDLLMAVQHNIDDLGHELDVNAVDAGTDPSPRSPPTGEARSEDAEIEATLAGYRARLASYAERQRGAARTTAEPPIGAPEDTP